VWSDYKALPAQMRAYKNMEEFVIVHRENEAKVLLEEVKLLR